MNFKAIVAIICIAILTFTTLVYALHLILKIITQGTIELEYALTAEPSNIDWGNVTLNTPINRSVDIDNVGTKNMTSLTMKYENPSANLLNYTVLWNCEGLDLPVGDVITATFTLTVYEATEGAFSFDIWIGDNV